MWRAYAVRIMSRVNTTKGVRHMSNEDLVGNVSEELYWDPKVASDAIAVSADHGRVTLRGTVGSFREKREAKKATERVYGVGSVDNKLEVALMNDDKREDAALRGDVLQALILDSRVPSSVDADVENGIVRLSGIAEWQYQRDEAEFVAGNVDGVVDVWNDVELTVPTPPAGDVEHDIKKAFERNAKLDANNLHVTTSDGTVTIDGTVRSWAEKDDAVAAAWAAPGVRDVNDRTVVLY
jgi:osmotically-inducible protein OsmY